MTKCVIKKLEGVITYVEVKGHATSNTFGRDIVCNSISIAVQNLAVGAANVAELQNSEMDIGADANFKLVMSLEDAKTIKLLSETFLIMMRMLSNQHSNYLEMELTDEKNIKED